MIMIISAATAVMAFEPDRSKSFIENANDALVMYSESKVYYFKMRRTAADKARVWKEIESIREEILTFMNALDTEDDTSKIEYYKYKIRTSVYRIERYPFITEKNWMHMGFFEWAKMFDELYGYCWDETGLPRYF